MQIDHPGQGDSWTLIAVSVGVDEAELVADALLQLGAVAVEESGQESGRVTLRTSLGDDGLGAAASLTERFPSVVIEAESIPRSVVDTWRDHATPNRVDDDLWLVPAWLEKPGQGSTVLIEPFDTFGLGNHPTTILALRLARRHAAPGSRVHDHGTGSGVIAIAMTLTHGCETSVDDIHPGSRAAVEHNSLINGVRSPRWQSGLPTDRVDVVVANILAPVLRSHASSMESAVAAGGIVILSGLRSDQVDEVVSHYAMCDEIDRIEDQGWGAAALRRR
ncbi:MAG: 50S ribosomal protein L11 methyltransferase [Ilumatobacteraceae bacterium]